MAAYARKYGEQAAGFPLQRRSVKIIPRQGRSRELEGEIVENVSWPNGAVRRQALVRSVDYNRGNCGRARSLNRVEHQRLFRLCLHGN